MDAPKTLQQAIVYFSDADRAFQYALNLRFPNGIVTCPRCGSEKNSFIKTRHIWFCAGCKKQFSIKVGTIFEDSPITLDKWMMAIWMLTACKNGVSSYELHRSIGVAQKSAWFMLHRIREAMKNGSLEKMGNSGPAEATKSMCAATYTRRASNFWSCLKRALKGTYLAVEPFHLDAYVTEPVFRFNNRGLSNNRQRFEKVIGQAGKRLTLAQLTGANGSATSR